MSHQVPPCLVLLRGLQIDMGATTILTQPPFDWDAFTRWLDDARRRGLTERAQLVIGLPMISSLGEPQ